LTPEQTWPAKFANHYNFLNVSNIDRCRRTRKSMLVPSPPSSASTG